MYNTSMLLRNRFDQIKEWIRYTGKNKPVKNFVTSISEEILHNNDFKDSLHVYIWTDSQKKRSRPLRSYCTNIALIWPKQRKLYYTKRIEPNMKKLKARLLHELQYSLYTNKLVEKNLFELLQANKCWITLDIDINPNPIHWSYVAYHAANEILWKKFYKPSDIPLTIRFKPNAPFASKTWDRWCRGMM